MKSEGACRGDEGFTLIETLVTVAVVSLLSLIIVAALGQVRSMNRISHETDAQVRYGAVLNYLETTLSNARSLRLLGRDDSKPVVLDGRSDQLEFTAIVKTGTERLSLRTVVWRQAVIEGQDELTQLTAPRRLGATEPINPPTVIIRDDMTLTFSYLDGSDRPGEAEPWGSIWQKAYLPKAIRIELRPKASVGVKTITRIVSLPSNPVVNR